VSDSRFRPRPRIPGDGCFLCDPRQRTAAYRRRIDRARAGDFDLAAWWPASPARDFAWAIEITDYEDSIQADSVLDEQWKAWLAAHPVQLSGRLLESVPCA
jgi:hypothetical protein